VYNSEFSPAAQAQLILIPYEAIDDLVETVVLVSADPWNFQRRPDESTDSHHVQRIVSFAEGRGFITFVILEHLAEVHVTQITWLG